MALAAWGVTAGTVTATADDEGKKVAIRDDCDPEDPAWAPTGAKTEVSELAAGNHRFQCCIHPWMRMLIKVEEENEDEN